MNIAPAPVKKPAIFVDEPEFSWVSGDADGVLVGSSFEIDIFFSPRVLAVLLEVDGLDFAAIGDALGEDFDD